jgi:hypothetical protein
MKSGIGVLISHAGQRRDDAVANWQNLQHRCRQPPASKAMPTMAPVMIMTMANSVSRTSVGLLSPCNMTAEMLRTSMAVTDSVSTSVP